MGLKEMLNASAIQAENARLKEENKKLKQKLEELGFDDYMEVKKAKEILEREISANKRVLANLDAHVEELNNRSNALDDQINEQIKKLIEVKGVNS